jgi:hypothetical protein
MFHLPNGAKAEATVIHKLHHNLIEPARSINIVPSLVGNSLLSTVKMVEAGYTAIYDDKEVNCFDTPTTKITVLAATILKGWQCPQAKLWRVPLVDKIRNKNTDTLLLNHLHKHDCLNLLYEVESTTTTREHTNTIMLQTIGRESIHNMYKLPSIEPTIRYLHAAAGFLVEKTWLKVIWRGNYNSWPLINITNVACHFLESEEMQKGHMRSQQQGVRSTKKKPLDAFPDTPTIPPHESKRDIFIRIYKLKKTMYSNQTGCFPKVSSLGNKYIMVIHDVDSNSSWADALKDNTGSELILAQAQALEQMQRAALSPNTKSWMKIPWF